MDEEQIHTILAVNRTGSFTRAASMLHVTQSTVTARIRQVERELGVPIWERTTRHLALTPQGRGLMALFERADILFARIHDSASPDALARQVVFGSVHSQWSAGVLPILQGWGAQQPGVRWRLITGHSGELLDKVSDGSVDAAVTYFPGVERGMQTTLLAEQRLRLLGSPDLVSTGAVLNTAQVRARPIAYVDWGPPFTDWFRQEFEDISPVVQVDQAPLLTAILLEGRHVGFMPAVLARELVRGGKLVDITYHPERPLPIRSVYAVSSERALVRPAVRSLWDYLRDQGPRLLGGRDGGTP